MAVVSRSLDTLAIHAGQEPDPSHAAVMQPIVLSSTFAQAEPGKPKRFEYSRSGNPTREALEACIAALEGGRHGFAFGSGSAATLTLLHTLRPGDHVISGDDVYGGTFRLFDKVLAPMGVETTFLDMRHLDRLEAAISDKTRLVWMETPTNPLLKLFDIRKIAGIAKGRGLPLVVDNTFASPMLQRPLELGATVVMHSTTKYINGHSDVVGGALVTSDEPLAERIRFLQNAIGAVPSPMDCYLVLRGLKTLPVRMRQHVKSASELARRLTEAKGVRVVHYPGLPTHPDHALCQAQMAGGGGMISLELDGGVDESRRFLSALRIFTLAESLGGVESLAEHPAIMTHASIPAEVRRSVGISDSLVRLSVGLEDVEDLWNDLQMGLAAMR
ncbi:MAG: PLP-dependent transferase [Polyangiaceae bacterium]|nr:PLP-dependent transferase [Polyangiaceae bacterium]MCL4753135.1 PLP-dependent aspartate aminotransferase family protein [Myxococcales bacterium]